jgi:protein involved in polysaccharide export with SLBB domain
MLKRYARFVWVCGWVFCAPGFAADPTGRPEAPTVRLGEEKRQVLPQILAVDDVIEVRVFEQPELDRVVRIPSDGKILLPLIGEIELGGRDLLQATRMIREKLAAGYLSDPHVSIFVREPGRRLFTVLGQVQRPGTYRFPERQPMNLIQAIGIAGGYTRLASLRRISVKRQLNGTERVFKLDGEKMAREEKVALFELVPGDIITVKERLF